MRLKLVINSIEVQLRDLRERLLEFFSIKLKVKSVDYVHDKCQTLDLCFCGLCGEFFQQKLNEMNTKPWTCKHTLPQQAVKRLRSDLVGVIIGRAEVDWKVSCYSVK